MSNDPYSLCPCGSGKKLKFCCGDILPDMMKVHRLEENQPETAEKILRDLLKKYPFREILVGEMWRLLSRLGKSEEARELLTGFLKKHPDHALGLVWMARFLLLTDGFTKSRRSIHRAFQISSKSHASQLAELAGAIGQSMMAQKENQAAREHMALAVRLAGNMSRGRELLGALARMESQHTIPLPLRTPQSLLPVSSSVENMQQDLRARKLSVIGCWEPAAILYSRMAESDQKNGAVHYNHGLCMAWDGRSKDAAAALHRAADLLDDDQTAIDAKSLAILIDQQQPEARYNIVQISVPVHSLSELVSRLGQDARLVSREYDEEEIDDIPEGMERAVTYGLLDRPLPETDLSDSSEISEAIAEIDVLDLVDERLTADEGISTPLLLVTVAEQEVPAVLESLRTICGEFMNLPAGAEPRQTVVTTMASELRAFDFNYQLPKHLSRRQSRELIKDLDRRLVTRWVDSPAESLGGKSPREAAGDPSLKRTLAASVQAMEAGAAIHDRYPDVREIRTLLNVSEPPQERQADGQSCAALSVFHLQRLDVRSLSDDQLVEYANRVAMLGLTPRITLALNELFQRPAAFEKFGVVRGCLLRATIARFENDSETINACMDRARTEVSNSRDNFRESLELDIRELSFRMDDPNDPTLITLLHRIRDRYLSKLPEIASVIHDQLAENNCEHLLSELEFPVAVGSATGSSLWTPGGGSAPESTSGQSLWLPGQD